MDIDVKAIDKAIKRVNYLAIELYNRVMDSKNYPDYNPDFNELLPLELGECIYLDFDEKAENGVMSIDFGDTQSGFCPFESSPLDYNLVDFKKALLAELIETRKGMN